MGIRSLMQLSAFLALLAVSNGKLPGLLRSVRVAQLELLKSAQTRHWGQPFLPDGPMSAPDRE